MQNENAFSHSDHLEEFADQNSSLVKTEPNVIEVVFPPDENTQDDIKNDNVQSASYIEEEIDHKILNDSMKFECVRYLALLQSMLSSSLCTQSIYSIHFHSTGGIQIL